MAWAVAGTASALTIKIDAFELQRPQFAVLGAYIARAGSNMQPPLKLEVSASGRRRSARHARMMALGPITIFASVLHAASPLLVSKKIGLDTAARAAYTSCLASEAAVITAFGPPAIATGEPAYCSHQTHQSKNAKMRGSVEMAKSEEPQHNPLRSQDSTASSDDERAPLALTEETTGSRPEKRSAFPISGLNKIAFRYDVGAVSQCLQPIERTFRLTQLQTGFVTCFELLRGRGGAHGVWCFVGSGRGRPSSRRRGC